MKKTLIWIKDYAYLLYIETIMYLIQNPPENFLGYPPKKKTPIVIIPGVFGRWTFLIPIANYMSLMGYPVYIVPKLGDNTKDIKASASLVREVIEKNNLKNAVIVAHSKGGLIGKYVLLHENHDSRVSGVIAIATPFHGSSIGNFFPHQAVAELKPESEIIKYLDEHSEVNKKIVSIMPSYDNQVWHKAGSLLEGALANIRVEHAGHHLVLGDKKVWEKVIEYIEKITSLHQQ